YHAHLELPGHLHRKLGDKSVRRATKDNIIHVYLNQKKISARSHEEQSFINTSHFKTLSEQKDFQSIIPSSRCLFQTVKSFLKFINMVWKFGIFETRGLLYINLFFNKTIQEGRFNIHLENLKTLGSSKCKKDSNSLQTSNRSKGFLKINTLFLAKPLGNKTRVLIL